jgi:hypothetical protein
MIKLMAFGIGKFMSSMPDITLLYSRWSLRPPKSVPVFSGIINQLSINYELHPDLVDLNVSLLKTLSPALLLSIPRRGRQKLLSMVGSAKYN